MAQSYEDNLQAEAAAAATSADAKALPQLRAYREKLEKEAGVLAAQAQTFRTRFSVLCGVAGLVAVYAAYASMTGEPPVTTLVVAGVLVFAVAVVSWRRNATERERHSELEALHEKMLAAGRRIDAVERRLRG